MAFAVRVLLATGVAWSVNIAPAAGQEVDVAKGETAVERLQAYETERNELKTRVHALTRQGHVEEALKLAARVKELALLIETEKKKIPKATRVVWELKQPAEMESVNGCVIENLDGEFFRISSPKKDGSYVQSKGVKFKPPFRIRARVATTSTNIRFFFARYQMAIFNWEMKRSELRIHDPVNRRAFGIAGKGQLETGTAHAIEIDVLADKLVIRANGAELAAPQVNYGGFEGPVGIGPAFGSVLRLESLAVESLK